jgi:hypothetical protein
MEVLEARITRLECECQSLRETLAGAMLAIEAHAHAAAHVGLQVSQALVEAQESARAVFSVNAELIARNVALTGTGAAGPIHTYHNAPHAPHGRTSASAVSAASTVVVRDDPAGVALLGNSATYAMRQDLKRHGSWVTDAPPRWLLPTEAWEQNRNEWSTRFGVTFVKE